MTEMLVRAPSFDFAAPVRPVGTLLDIADVQEGIGWLDPAGLAESYNCLVLDSAAVWPCPAVTLAAPTSIAGTTATTGGTLTAGTYRAIITAVNARGETIGSSEQSQVTTGATSTITWKWNALTGAVSYKVYVTAVGGATGTETYQATVTAPTVQYVQTAPRTAGGAAVPTTNTAYTSTSKNFETPTWQDGIRFAVYGGIKCKGPGFDMAAAESKTQAAFEAMESVGVERALMTTRFVAGTGWTAATDLTPAGGAVSASIGLALLEGDAACKYAGTPVIHAPRAVASLLSTIGAGLDREGNRLVSKLGTPIAAGGGYACPNNSPTGTAPAAGEAWMYASGAVRVARGELLVKSDIDRDQNDVYILAERAYVAAVDCYTAAVRVKVSS